MKRNKGFYCKYSCNFELEEAGNHPGVSGLYFPAGISPGLAKIVCILLLFSMIVLYGANPASAKTGPLAFLQPKIEKGIEILRDPRYKAPEKKEEQREAIWETVHDAFDFTEISIRSLALGWRQLSESQKAEFVDTFTELLKTNYLDKLQGAYQNEKVIFLGEEALSEDKAMVKTKVIRENTEIPMDYSMRYRDGNWRIYDIRIEGVSLVKNYRTQFRDMLGKMQPDELIRELKEKNRNMKTKRLEEATEKSE